VKDEKDAGEALDALVTAEVAPEEVISTRIIPNRSNSVDNGIAADDELCNWKFLCEGATYTPTSSDIGCSIKIEVTALNNSPGNNSVLAGPFYYYTDGVLIAAKLPKRSFASVNSNNSANNGNITSNSVRFRIVSYNTLAELYATKAIYGHCDPWVINWNYRKQLILQGLYDIQGDVVCLQEVQADHYESYLYPAMVKDGYEGLFKPKSRESMGLYGKVSADSLYMAHEYQCL
jgi:CCR4-NOT transcription complex subunit 6